MRQSASGEQFLTLFDPDGLRIELVEGAPDAENPHRIRGFHGATMSLEGYEATARLMTDAFGYNLVNQEGNRFRYMSRECRRWSRGLR